ncbi:MAG: BCCT family transporter [bacterium]
MSKIKPESKKRDLPVFWSTFLLATIFIIWGIIDVDSLSYYVNNVFDFLVETFGWLYLLYGSVVLILVLIVGFSKYGKIKLGKPDEDPEFTTVSWIAMLFSAGMGIGLVFWGVAEPISHYANPPFGQAETGETALLAMRYSFFHWGLHPWALYALFGMLIAYFSFRRGLPQLPSSALYPLIGKEGVEGPLGKGFDIICAFITLVGIATSLGLGAQQINSGLNYLTGIPNTTGVAVMIIAVITIAFIISAITGLDRGIKYLSNVNISLASVVLVLMLIVGPTIFIFDYFIQSLGGYFQHMFEMSTFTSAFEGSSWPAWWTMFYWAWWTTWVPFVGGFIARISRGRTIKEFVIGVLLVPTVVSLFWFATMGGSGIWLEQFANGGIVEKVNIDVSSAIFATMSNFPLGGLMSVLVTILISTFFITSADSGTFVMGMLTSGGILEPSLRSKVTWGVFEGFIAIVLLLAGGLSAVQNAAIAVSFPFMIVVWFAIYSFFKELKKDHNVLVKDEFIGALNENTDEDVEMRA